MRTLLSSAEFVDKAPATVFHELLDEGVHLASVSSMYPILRAHNEAREMAELEDIASPWGVDVSDIVQSAEQVEHVEIRRAV